MLQKIQWLHPWRFRHDVRKNYDDIELSHYVFAELTYGKKSFDILLPKEQYFFKTDGQFYGFAQRSILQNVEVKPNERLAFETCSCHYPENKTQVKIKKISSNDYFLTIYSEENNIDIKEPLSKRQLQLKLQSLEPTIEVYPFVLPFGNCFSLT